MCPNNLRYRAGDENIKNLFIVMNITYENGELISWE